MINNDEEEFKELNFIVEEDNERKLEEAHRVLKEIFPYLSTRIEDQEEIGTLSRAIGILQHYIDY